MFHQPGTMFHPIAILVYLIYLNYQTNYYVSPDSYTYLTVYPVN